MNTPHLIRSRWASVALILAVTSAANGQTVSTDTLAQSLAEKRKVDYQNALTEAPNTTPGSLQDNYKKALDEEKKAQAAAKAASDKVAKLKAQIIIRNQTLPCPQRLNLKEIAKTPAATKPTDGKQAAATTNEPTDFFHNVINDAYKNLYIRESIFAAGSDLPISGVPDLPTQPATLNYAHPNHGRDTFNTDIGVGLYGPMGADPDNNTAWGLGVDYHRNTGMLAMPSAMSIPAAKTATKGATATKAKAATPLTGVKDLIQPGGILTYHFAKECPIWLQGGLSYMDDRTKGAESYLGSADVNWIPGCYNNNYWNGLLCGGYRIYFFGGLTGQDSLDGSGSKEGSQVLGEYGFNVRYSPFYRAWMLTDPDWNTPAEKSQHTFWRNIKLLATGTGYSRASSTGADSLHKNWNGLLETSLQIPIGSDPTKSEGTTTPTTPDTRPFDFSIKLTWKLGDDPIMDQFHQNTLTLALSAKY